jgi:hypothetical protein
MEPRNKREEKLLVVLQAEPRNWYAGQAGRRRVVVLGTLLLGLLWANAGVSWVLAPSNAAMITCFVILGIVLLAGCLLWNALTVSTRGTVGLPEHLLDERQRGERLRGQAIAQRLTLLLVFAAFFLLIVALPDDQGVVSDVPAAAVVLLALALLATIAALPTLVVAWRQIDPPKDDEDDEDAPGAA